MKWAVFTAKKGGTASLISSLWGRVFYLSEGRSNEYTAACAVRVHQRDIQPARLPVQPLAARVEGSIQQKTTHARYVASIR